MHILRIVFPAAAIAVAGLLIAVFPADAGGKKRSSGSSHGGHAANIGSAMIGYGLSGGIQRAIQNAPATQYRSYDDEWDEEYYMSRNIRALTPDELKQRRALAKQRARQGTEAEATRETLNLFLGLGGFGR